MRRGGRGGQPFSAATVAVAALPGDGKEACDQPELEQRAPAAEIIGGHDAEDGSIASGSTT
jgi:hypothetical protein